MIVVLIIDDHHLRILGELNAIVVRIIVLPRLLDTNLTT